MKLLSILLIAFFLLSCERSGNVSDFTTIGKAGMMGPIFELSVDGCQYILIGSGGYTHKGTCSNPIHKCPCK